MTLKCGLRAGTCSLRAIHRQEPSPLTANKVPKPNNIAGPNLSKTIYTTPIFILTVLDTQIIENSEFQPHGQGLMLGFRSQDQSWRSRYGQLSALWGKSSGPKTQLNTIVPVP